MKVSVVQDHMSAQRKQQPMIVGQGALCVSDVPRASAFFGNLGLRAVLLHPHLAVLELRGGTHLVLFQARGDHPRGRVRSFALLVDDAALYRDHVCAQGIDAGPMLHEPGSRQQHFDVVDLDGHVLTVSSAATA